MSADGTDTFLTVIEDGTPENVLRQASAVCALLAEGKSLKHACAEPNMPARATFYLWLGRYQDVLDMYTRAREERSDLLADEILEIADSPIAGVSDDDDSDDEGAKRKFRQALEQRRQMIDARKWAAAKLNPKVYSDRTNLEHSGSVKITHENALAALE